ncbi:MAG TPA: hypothetical protein VN397_00765 [Candidatus Methylomirabilis sp.]|nr:hypothetical protein [Candidatus Methylomirabilis sp.]
METQRTFRSGNPQLAARDRLQIVLPFVAEPVVEAAFCVILAILLPFAVAFLVILFVIDVFMSLLESLGYD